MVKSKSPLKNRAAAAIADEQDSMGSVEVVVKCLKKDDSECGVQVWAREKTREARQGSRIPSRQGSRSPRFTE